VASAAGAPARQHLIPGEARYGQNLFDNPSSNQGFPDSGPYVKSLANIKTASGFQQHGWVTFSRVVRDVPVLHDVFRVPAQRVAAALLPKRSGIWWRSCHGTGPDLPQFPIRGGVQRTRAAVSWFRTGNLSTRTANKTRRVRRRPQNFGNGVAELLLQAERRFSCADARHLDRFLRAF